MKKILLLFFLMLYSAFFSQDSLKTQRILIVATNVNLVGKNQSGTFLPEIATPFKYFIEKGYDVDVMTPKGGQASIYSWGDVERNELFISKTKNSLSPNEVKPGNYIAVFYPGGHGQFFDVVKDTSICNQVAKIYENGGYLAACGHGMASFINIKLSNSKYLVEGKTMTCFPNWSELQSMSISDYGKLLPFDMEKVLAERGAFLKACPSQAKTSLECTRVIDEKNRMITGAFAGDAKWVAEEIVKQIQKKIK